MSTISRPAKWSAAKWSEMVKQSKEAIETFHDFADDKAIVWADNQIKDYKRAMLILARSNKNWQMFVSDDDEKLVETMIARAK